MVLPIDRRALIVGGGATALVVPIAATLGGNDPQDAPATPRAPLAATATAAVALGPHLKIDLDNTVTLFIGPTEMGQGIMTGLAQLVAEELQLAWTQVRVEHAIPTPTNPNPYANPLFRMQVTGGSTSMRGWYLPLRTAAAVARDTLIAAAQKLKPGVAWSLGQDGTVVGGGGSYRFADLVATAATLPPPATAALATTRKVIGQRMPRTDIPAKLDGSAVYGLDVVVPNMVFAAVVHCPTLGGTVAAMPAKPAGTLAVVNLDNAVAVVANDTWTAMRAAEGLTSAIRWTLPANLASRDSAAIEAQARALAASTAVTPHVYETKGTYVPTALADARTRIDATYQLPYLAHACMEVLNCTASVTATTAEIWAPTQGQAMCVPTIQQITGLAPDRITVHTTYLGGGLGRKIEQDYIAQAVKVSKALGRPVKLTWSRKQDFQNDKYRPCAAIRVQAGVDNSGAVVGLLYRNVSPSINIQRNTVPGNNPEDTGAVAGALALPYAIPNRQIEYVPLPADIPLGYWRSVGESYNTFAVESAIDELALAAGVDPMAYRKTLLAGDPRALGVVNAVDALSGWSKAPAPAGSAYGMAFLSGFGSYIATVVQVSLSKGQLRCTKAFVAIDCGVAVNPEQIEAQIEGGVAHGLSAALWGEVTFANGVPNVTNFSNYRLVRRADMPQVAVSIVPSTAPPGGVGETGVPCMAPALANAYARLTGQRVRSLPFQPGARMGDG